VATTKGKGPGRVEVRVECRGGAYASRVLRGRAREFLDALGQGDAELSVLLTGDAGIRRINREFRGKDRATDVLSFPSGGGPRPPGAPPFLGDLAISLETARRVAREDRRPLADELARYLAHGLLHLLGHDHERSAREATRMAAAEERLLGRTGLVTCEGPPPNGARRASVVETRRSGRRR
jgi:probable rRNA maturation factor